MDFLHPSAALVTVLPRLVAAHLGALHPVEQLLTVVLAFGPFVLLAVVVVVRRRQDAAAEAGDHVPDGRDGPGRRQDPDR